MTARVDQERIDRRNFLKALGLTAVAASATGGGAALLARRAEQAPVVTSVVSPPPVPAAAAVETVAEAGTGASDLLSKLASAQAENMRLRAELDAAQRRVTNLENANGDVGQVNEALQTELASANGQVSALAGLVALYEQLESIDVVEAVGGGLDSFGDAMGNLVDDLPTLEEGLTRGHQALDELEAQIPAVASGRDWLESHLRHLTEIYAAAQVVLSSAVEAAGSFLQMLADWFEGVRKWLPFGIGDKAAEVMAALTELLDETPNTIQGLQRNVAQPLDVWLSGEGEEVALRGHLIKPLKEEALNPAAEVAARVRKTRESYQVEIVEPAKIAAQSRELLRAQIAEYRQQHQI